MMQEGKEDINKSVFKIMSACLMKKEKKCGNKFIFYIYTIFYHTSISCYSGAWVYNVSFPKKCLPNI